MRGTFSAFQPRQPKKPYKSYGSERKVRSEKNFSGIAQKHKQEGSAGFKAVERIFTKGAGAKTQHMRIRKVQQKKGRLFKGLVRP